MAISKALWYSLDNMSIAYKHYFENQSEYDFELYEIENLYKEHSVVSVIDIFKILNTR